MRRLVPLLVAALLAGGCWDRLELGDLALVTGMAIDAGDEFPYRLSVQVILPPQVGGPAGVGGTGTGRGGVMQGQTVALHSRGGRSITEAMTSLQQEIRRELRYGHTSFIVLGESLARRGIREVFQFLATHPDIRVRTQVYVAEGEGLEILRAQPSLEAVPGAAVEEMGNMMIFGRVTVGQVADKLSREGIEPFIPRLAAVPALSPGGPQSGAGGGAGAPARLELRLTGTALFKGDRLVGFIGPEETRGLLWARNLIRESVVNVYPPEGGFVTANLVRGATKLAARVTPGGPAFRLEARGVTDLLGDSARLDLDDPTVVRRLERLVAETVAERIRWAVEAAQRLETDVLGFGAALFRHEPRAWRERWAREWEAVFPTVPLEVAIQVQARRMGLVPEPVGAPETPFREFPADEPGKVPQRPDTIPPGGRPPFD